MIEKLEVCVCRKVRCDGKVRSLKKKLESKQGLSFMHSPADSIGRSVQAIARRLPNRRRGGIREASEGGVPQRPTAADRRGALVERCPRVDGDEGRWFSNVLALTEDGLWQSNGACRLILAE